ncbi:MAG TPA: hypothetical protein GX716_00675 [Firmicutes bacterium]|nr:hypothetical protein [Candidatus Fermentithermobacillaceae bacterium]
MPARAQSPATADKPVKPYTDAYRLAHAHGLADAVNLYLELAEDNFAASDSVNGRRWIRRAKECVEKLLAVVDPDSSVSNSPKEGDFKDEPEST